MKPIRCAAVWRAGAVLVLLGSACGEEDGQGRGTARPQGSPGMDLVRTSELHAGPTIPTPSSAENPYEGDSRALQQGERYYNWFNCAGCHGGSGGGGIGPVLADEAWIYGGSPAQIYESILKGRPNGMPSFGGQIPEDRIWMIVAYVRSLPEQAGEGGS